MMFFSRSVNGFAAHGFRSNNPFPVSNHTTVNQARSMLARNGRNGGSREFHRRGRHSATFANVLIQDGNNGAGNKEKDLLAEKIRHHLRTRFYQIPSSSSDQDSGFCAVCQSEYENGETLGLLDCGHEYHVDCIHKWLLENNVCPLCKRTAISQLKNL